MARTASARRTPPPPPPIVSARHDGDRRARILQALRMLAAHSPIAHERDAAERRIRDIEGTPAPAPQASPQAPTVAPVPPQAPQRPSAPQARPASPPPPQAPAGAFPFLPPGTTILDTDGRTYQIRRRDGIVYCTCAEWLRSAARDRVHPESATCDHKHAYLASQAPVAPPPPQAPPPPSAPTVPPASPSAPRSRPASPPAPAPQASPQAPTVATLRTASTGSQWLQFARKPDATVRDALKRNGWRWHSVREQWYHGPHGRVPACVRTVDADPPVPPVAPAPETVSAPQAPAARVPVSTLRIGYTEGLDLNGWRRVTFTTFGACNLALRDLASRAPGSGGGYHKTDVLLGWADASEFKIRIDLTREHATYPRDLVADELRAHLTFHAGRLPTGEPGQLTRADYLGLVLCGKCAVRLAGMNDAAYLVALRAGE